MNTIFLLAAEFLLLEVSGSPVSKEISPTQKLNDALSKVMVDPRVIYGNANYYIDLMLWNVNRQLPDVLPIPDIGGPFNMKNCFFLGLEYGITRDGNATFVVNGNEVRFFSPFKMLNSGITCDWRFGLLHGKASGTTAKVSIDSGITLILDHGESPQLTEFLVTQLEPVQTDITGLTPLYNWLAEDIADWIISGFDDEITYVIENDVAAVVQEILDTMTIP